MKLPFLVRLNLQHFASDVTNNDDPVKDELDNPDANGGADPEDKPEGDKPTDSKTFTQEDIDRIVKERLERERKKREEAIQKEREEAERKRLAENEQYKELADKLQAQLDAIKEDALKAKKDALLAKAGYTEEQIEKYSKYVDGTTDEELAESVEALKADIPPQTKTYADPHVNNGPKNEPKKTDLQQKGKSMYQRLKEKGKIRGRK